MVDALRFTVDARLLEELGERLVGKPSTALAELVKNAYDADATFVRIILDQSGSGLIRVSDNGHGMTREEFQKYWMRLGSQHKREKRVSRKFKRPYTGSKGVGRIAAQLLSNKLRIESVSEEEPSRRLTAELDWRQAIEAGELTDARVTVREETAGQAEQPGTTLILRGLKQQWTDDRVRELAREIWQLQPPFSAVLDSDQAHPQDFRIEFEGPEEDLVQTFDDQIQAILQLWTAKAIGENHDGKARLALQFRSNEWKTYEFTIPNSLLLDGRFELRFYDLQGRQPHGIRVSTAREYLSEFGGVHIYDTGFRLPFYGEKDNDWLLISHDTSRRLAMSDLLPRDLQVTRGMLSLPQWQQVLGMVEINTANEPELEVTITRDRLVESKAFEQLRDFVRRAIHWYANEKAKRRLTESVDEKPIQPLARVGSALELLDKNADQIPPGIAEELRSVIRNAKEEITEQESRIQLRIGALSSFATAGIAALGYQHELSKQLLAVESLAKRLEEALASPEAAMENIPSLVGELREWVWRARQTGRMFSHFGSPEDLKTEKRFKARELLEAVINQIDPLRREVRFDIEDVDRALRLPPASYTEWVSVFQNIFFNALNALIESERRIIRIYSDGEDVTRRLVFEDTGSGINLDKAEEYFEPLARGISISDERRELGFGGAGLGLTIVRMIAQSRNFEVGFREPSPGFSTSLVLEWKETSN